MHVLYKIEGKAIFAFQTRGQRDAMLVAGTIEVLNTLKIKNIILSV